MPEDDQDSSGLKKCVCNCIQQIPGANTRLDEAADIPDYSDLNNINSAIIDLDNTFEQSVATVDPDDNSYNLGPSEIPNTQQFGDDPDQMIERFTFRFEASDLPDYKLPDINSKYLTDCVITPHGEKYIVIITVILLYIVLKLLLV